MLHDSCSTRVRPHGLGGRHNPLDHAAALQERPLAIRCDTMRVGTHQSYWCFAHTLQLSLKVHVLGSRESRVAAEWPSVPTLSGSERFPFNNFKLLFSKSFSSFPHGTCSLSVSCLSCRWNLPHLELHSQAVRLEERASTVHSGRPGMDGITLYDLPSQAKCASGAKGSKRSALPAPRRWDRRRGRLVERTGTQQLAPRSKN